MKQMIAELSCLGLLLIGTAGIVTSLFVGPRAQLPITSLFALVMISACVAKMLLPARNGAANG